MYLLVLLWQFMKAVLILPILTFMNYQKTDSALFLVRLPVKVKGFQQVAKLDA